MYPDDISLEEAIRVVSFRLCREYNEDESSEVPDTLCCCCYIHAITNLESSEG